MSLNKKDECSVYNGWVIEDGDVLELHSLMVLLQMMLLDINNILYQLFLFSSLAFYTEIVLPWTFFVHA